MNTFYLLRHISYRLHTFVRQFDSDLTCLNQFCARHDFSDMLSRNTNLYRQLFQHFNHDLPKMILVNDRILYGTARTEDSYYLIGPVRLSASMSFKYRLNIDKTISEDWIQSVPLCDYSDFITNILLIHNLFHTEIIDHNQFTEDNLENTKTRHSIQQHLSDILFENRESGSHHNPYDQEVREVASIRNGDVEQLKKSWNEDYTGKIGTLAKDRLRNNKNLGIVLVTLASRAAMEGGVVPEEAYSLSDSYICQIEECHDADTAYDLGKQAEYQYCLMVNEVRQNRKNLKRKGEMNHWVNLAKNYIFSHLHDKITVAEIADEIHINANYLSGIFKEYEGISMSEFIIREKIKLTQNLLIYSKYSYIEIAAYLGFSSQSHLGRHFKRITGKTLHQYREEYGVKDFQK